MWLFGQTTKAQNSDQLEIAAFFSSSDKKVEEGACKEVICYNCYCTAIYTSNSWRFAQSRDYAHPHAMDRLCENNVNEWIMDAFPSLRITSAGSKEEEEENCSAVDQWISKFATCKWHWKRSALGLVGSNFSLARLVKNIIQNPKQSRITSPQIC